MSVGDPVKDRAEKRAERELQLKIDTLSLEREKFRYTKRQAANDRTGAAAVRAAAALLFAHGSVLVVCLTSYKSISETLTQPVFQKDIFLLAVGFILAMMAFSAALTLSAVSPNGRWSERGHLAFFIWFGITAVTSFGVLGWILATSHKALGGS